MLGTGGGSQTLVHLSRNQTRPSDPELPRGECRFILPKSEAENPQQRCCCVSFTRDNSVPGSRCGCGHQAWHHLAEPSERYVPLEEHVALLDRLKQADENIRRMQEELQRERRERETNSRRLVDMVRGNYNNMYFLRYMLEEKLEVQRIHCEDKTEGVLDKAHGALEDIEKLKARIADIDENMIKVEEKVDSSRWISRSATPFPDSVPDAPPPIPSTSKLPYRTEEKHPEAWDVKIILVPTRKQQQAFSIDSIAYRRCQSRGMIQDLHFHNKTAQQFVQCVDAGFATILRGRQWLPLQCLRSESMALGELKVSQIMYLIWDWRFLEEHCLATDKARGDIIYIALQDSELSWTDIRNLPRVFGSDETCWHPDAELDGETAVSLSKQADRMDYQMHTTRTQNPTSNYDHLPPPYTSNSPRLPSALGVLAAAASYSSSSSSAVTSPVNTPNPISALLNDEDYDEHRNKRPKRGALRPEPQPTGIPIERPRTSGSSSIVSSPPRQTIIYGSARSKRSIPAKAKEPMDWRVSEMKFGGVKSFMHRTSKTTTAISAAELSSTSSAAPSSSAAATMIATMGPQHHVDQH